MRSQISEEQARLAELRQTTPEAVAIAQAQLEQARMQAAQSQAELMGRSAAPIIGLKKAGVGE